MTNTNTTIRSFRSPALRRAARKLIRHQTDYRSRVTGGYPVGDARTVLSLAGIPAPWGWAV